MRSLQPGHTELSSQGVCFLFVIQSVVSVLQWFLANLSYQEALSDTQVAIVNILSSTSGERPVQTVSTQLDVHSRCKCLYGVQLCLSLLFLCRPVHAHPGSHISQQQQRPLHLVQAVGSSSEVSQCSSPGFLSAPLQGLKGFTVVMTQQFVPSQTCAAGPKASSQHSSCSHFSF